MINDRKVGRKRHVFFHLADTTFISAIRAKIFVNETSHYQNDRTAALLRTNAFDLCDVPQKCLVSLLPVTGTGRMKRCNRSRAAKSSAHPTSDRFRGQERVLTLRK
jgi:hypothetical protein